MGTFEAISYTSKRSKNVNGRLTSMLRPQRSRSFLLRCVRPVVCRFLDAGNSPTLRTLSGPASKKRQGTKSREVGHRLGSERYGD